MTLDGIRVNHAALEQAATDMMQGVTDINERLNRLEGELKPLRNDWIGDQQISYQEAKSKWDGAIAEMTQLLTETHRAVSDSRLDYMTADSNGAKRFQ
ncbi:hypothetical protein BH09ACT12_BH09ACT12_05280 [soil metagenome]